MRRGLSLSPYLWVICAALAGSLALTAPPARVAPRAPTPADSVHITLLGTTDLHGHVEPLDYYTNKPANLGLAKIATLIRQARAEQPDALLLDSGDTIQGTPLAYYYAEKDTHATNPMMLLMNSLGYDAMAVGNHEFNFGLDVLWKAKREAQFPILGANIEQAYSGGVPYFKPYIIKQVDGVRVAIVGFVTPGIPTVGNPRSLPRICIRAHRGSGQTRDSGGAEASGPRRGDRTFGAGSRSGCEPGGELGRHRR